MGTHLQVTERGHWHADMFHRLNLLRDIQSLWLCRTATMPSLSNLWGWKEKRYTHEWSWLISFRTEMPSPQHLKLPQMTSTGPVAEGLTVPTPFTCHLKFRAQMVIPWMNQRISWRPKSPDCPNDTFGSTQSKLYKISTHSLFKIKRTMQKQC